MKSAWESPRTLCHGDLRWHNTLAHQGTLRFIDLEHAGLGDPAADLALMACRTPLSLDEEMQILDGLQGALKDKGLVHRFLTLKPLLGLLGGLGGVLDLAEIKAEKHQVAVEAGAHVRRRLPLIVEELEDAMTRILGKRFPRPKVSWPKRKPLRGRPPPGGIALDGTALSGKSVIAEELSRKFQMPHYNTGALYRFAALLALQENLHWKKVSDQRALLKTLGQSSFAMTQDGRLQVGKSILDEALHVLEVSRVVARWAAHPPLRALINAKIEKSMGGKSAVVEGRDIAQTHLQSSPHSFFVDANVHARAQRLVDRAGRPLTVARAKKWILERDGLDATRSTAPMKMRRGALRVDTTLDTVAETMARVLRRLER
jgi:cytidylate kinase